MSDEQNVDVAVEVDYKAEAETLKAEREKLENHNKTLFAEKKSQSQKLKELQERLQSYEAKTDESKTLEERFKSQQEINLKLQKELEDKEQKYSSERIQANAMKLANDLGPLNGESAEILADYLAKRLKVVDGELMVLDASGGATVKSQQDLIEEFKSSSKFKPLLLARQSTGGGASGNSNGVTKNVVKRDTFDGWNPQARMDFIKQGGKTID